MLTIALMVAMLTMPPVLWIAGLHQMTLLIGIVVALCVPSMAHVIYLTIKHKTWPTITGGPRFTWPGKNFRKN